MTQELWNAVDQYVRDELALTDQVLAAALAANTEGGLPPIDVTASQGKLLYMLARHGGFAISTVV
ncbi:MAG TPA: hypothetical protein VM053_02955 [Gemmatimonadaceae bacterium]|nr:hypothetical protein [Gemmatimonadaceae bacterium]